MSLLQLVQTPGFTILGERNEICFGDCRCCGHLRNHACERGGNWNRCRAGWRDSRRRASPETRKSKSAHTQSHSMSSTTTHILYNTSHRNTTNKNSTKNYQLSFLNIL